MFFEGAGFFVEDVFLDFSGELLLELFLGIFYESQRYRIDSHLELFNKFALPLLRYILTILFRPFSELSPQINQKLS